MSAEGRRRGGAVVWVLQTALLAPVAVLTAFSGIGGPVYLVTSLVLNMLFLRGAIAIWKRDEVQAEADGYRAEKSFFKLSLAYLFLHFGALLVDSSLDRFGWGLW